MSGFIDGGLYGGYYMGIINDLKDELRQDREDADLARENAVIYQS